MVKLQVRQIPKGLTRAGIGVIVLALLGVGGWLFEKPAQVTHTAVDSSPKNLFALISQLNGTTNQMLANTEGLQDQVQQVQGKLGELSAQELILQKQMQTGNELAQALTMQEQLTGTGVALMGQILDREKQSVQITDHVSEQADQLAQHVAKNAVTLQQLASPLNTSASESEALNGQMDQLLAELRKSQDTFQLFGTLDDILHNPLDLPKLPGASGGGAAQGGTGDSGGGLLGGDGGILGGILH